MISQPLVSSSPSSPSSPSSSDCFPLSLVCMLDIKSSSYLVMNFSDKVDCISYGSYKVCTTYWNSLLLLVSLLLPFGFKVVGLIYFCPLFSAHQYPIRRATLNFYESFIPASSFRTNVRTTFDYRILLHTLTTPY
jgi:hypothetical protein